MALAIKNKSAINMEVSEKYNSYITYIQHLLKNHKISKNDLKENLKKDLNILDKDILKEVSKSDEATIKGLVYLEEAVKSILLDYIFEEENQKRTLPKKPMLKSIIFFEELLEENKDFLSDITFNNEVISNERETYNYSGINHYVIDGKMIKQGLEGNTIEINPKTIPNIKKLGILKYKTLEIINGEEYIKDDISYNKFIKVTDNNKLTLNQFPQTKKEILKTSTSKKTITQQNVTLYDKIKKDIRIMSEAIKDTKENKIKLKTFIGYLKTISFVTEDVLKNKMLYLTASLEKTPLFNTRDDNFSLISTYDNMAYGQLLEFLSKNEEQLKSPKSELHVFDGIQGFNEHSEKIYNSAIKSGILNEEDKPNKTPSVDMLQKIKSKTDETINYIEIKNYTPSGDHMTRNLKRPFNEISRMKKQIKLADLHAKLEGKTSEVEVKGESVYKINVFHKGKKQQIELNMKDYIRYYEEVNKAIIEALNETDEEGNIKKVELIYNSFIPLKIKINDKTIKVKIFKDKKGRINFEKLREKGIMSETGRDVEHFDNLALTYSSPEAYVELMQQFASQAEDNVEQKIQSQEKIKIKTP